MLKAFHKRFLVRIGTTGEIMKDNKCALKYNSIAQLLFRSIINTYDHGSVNKGILKLLRLLRHLILTVGDPLVRYNLNGIDILIPFSHELPYYRKIFTQYSQNIGRIAKYISEKYTQLRIIDIGANVGDTVAILRGYVRFPILCIEGNRRFFSILQSNLPSFNGEVYCENAFVGSSTGIFQGVIQSEQGTAFLLSSQQSTEQIKVKTLTDILREHAFFQEAKFLKIDTDGFDSRILISEKEFLKKIKPIIFMEYDPYSTERYNDECFLVFDMLKTIGYEIIMVYDNFGDYLLTAELSNNRLLEDIHQYFSGRGGKIYADICAFHAEDSDLAHIIRSAEVTFFKKIRKVSLLKKYD
jgi:FkbM family methyltransferase